jgi:hypothetical protein
MRWFRYKPTPHFLTSNIKRKAKNVENFPDEQIATPHLINTRVLLLTGCPNFGDNSDERPSVFVCFCFLRVYGGLRSDQR